MSANERGSRRSRALTEEEHKLWRSVARSITPLARRAAPMDASDARPSIAVMPKLSPKAHPVSPPPPAKKPPALAPLDRRDRQKLARGTQSIDARIDLHGMTQAEAHAALLRFLRRAQADGAKFALVITGKGSTERGERGVLKRQVPLWLKLPELRPYVIGFEDAHIAHGGEGALYVRVRRA